MSWRLRTATKNPSPLQPPPELHSRASLPGTYGAHRPEKPFSPPLLMAGLFLNHPIWNRRGLVPWGENSLPDSRAMFLETFFFSSWNFHLQALCFSFTIRHPHSFSFPCHNMEMLTSLMLSIPRVILRASGIIIFCHPFTSSYMEHNWYLSEL